MTALAVLLPVLAFLALAIGVAIVLAAGRPDRGADARDGGVPLVGP